MNDITLVMLCILLVAFATLSYFQIKKVKDKIGKIINEEVQDKKLQKLIIKAQGSSKIKFIIYEWLSRSVISPVIVTLIMLAMDFWIGHNEPELIKYLVVSAFMFAIISLNVIVSANSIWNSCQ
ncbi:MAG TPA: hypothetical protein VKA10_07925 [Prolixibacteraceae bacterium]|nr:hypothetical protein [Prolixibacteraceae bacterium]